MYLFTVLMSIILPPMPIKFGTRIMSPKMGMISLTTAWEGLVREDETSSIVTETYLHNLDALCAQGALESSVLPTRSGV